ncbi:MAG: hypothetical protein AB1Y26_02075 [Cycloclasticus sp.]
MSLFKKAAGPLLLLSFALTVFSAFMPAALTWVQGGVMWLAGIILFFDLAARQKKIILTISLLAISSWVVAWQTGEISHIVNALLANQLMIVMLIGVQFLQLVALPVDEKTEPLPTGRKAFIRTYLGVHFFGSVINISSVLLVADRLVKEAKLSMNQQKLLTRAFTSGAHWSPFFAAFAAALVFTSEASLPVVFGVGLSMASLAFFITLFEANKNKSEALNNFVGYPMHFEALWLPVGLVIIVSAAHYIFPAINMLVLIALSSLLMSVVVLLIRQGLAEGCSDFTGYALNKLPQMKNELLLFLIAGVLGSGLAAALDGLSIAIPFDHFDGLVASAILLFMFLLAVLGVHPVISIAVIGHWIATVEPNQTLLAIMFLMSWAIGVSTSPISGINLALHGRYGVSGQQIFKWNLSYALKMYLFDCVVLMIVAHLLGV